MSLLLSVLEQGFIYAILALGVYITFKILDFPDMSVDSSFPLGAAVTSLMISNGISPLLTLPASLAAGALAGAVTGIIHVRFHVRDLLSGIIVMTGLYSINLHIAGRANVQLFTFNTIFKNGLIDALPASLAPYAPVIILALLTLLLKLLMDAYLATRSGFLLRATGDNPTLVSTLAQDSGKVKILGLSIANALVALSGCVICQYQRYFDISMGTGTLVQAVASVIIGMQLLGGLRFLRATTAVIIGSILYKGCVALALSFGLSPFNLRLITAALLLVIIVAGDHSGHRKKVKRHA
ncbi:MAG: ABC transporter permease [Clostridia bacterium]|nr:ABC transporter permease [Clostridia bacterium]